MFTIPKWKVVIERNCIVPKGYGIAWHDHMRCEIYCYLVPFNYIIAFIRWLYLGVKFPEWFRQTSAFEFGRDKGREETLEKVGMELNLICFYQHNPCSKLLALREFATKETDK